MDVAEARAFLVLAEELHFGRAADRLNIAQPPLSRIIKQLERRLKVQLFDRSTRRVELTIAGAALIEPARHLVEASATAVQAARDAAAGNTGTVRLGFASASVRHSVATLARTVQERFPGVTLELNSSLLSANSLKEVVTGELDCAIGRWDALPSEVSSRKLFREEIVVLVAENHAMARAKKTSVAMAELRDEDWIVLPSGPGAALRNRFTTLAKRAGFIPSIRSTAPDSWTQLVLVAAGMGVAITLDSVRGNANEDQLHYMQLEDAERFLDVQFVWRSDNVNPALSNLLDCVDLMFPAEHNPRPHGHPTTTCT